MTHTTPDTQENPEWVLIAKALNGELSDEEKKVFSDWLGQEEAHAVQWAEAMQAWQQVESEKNNSFEPNVALAWERFCAKTEFNAVASMPVPSQETAVRPLVAFNSFLKYAAVFVLAAGLAWLGYTQFYNSEQWTQIATLSGERKVIYLPDSSTVVLNELSTLRYQEKFTGNERLVELTGEGFFNVKKNPAQPFIINSGNAQTKVLGTSFNVKALQNAKEVIVTVSTGKVSFSSLASNRRIILTSGFTGRMLADGSVVKAKTMEDLVPSWQVLRYDGASLLEMEASLEGYFGVDITLANQSLKACTFTGTFNQPNLKEIFAVLAASNGLAISQPAVNKYVVSGNGCQ